MSNLRRLAAAFEGDRATIARKTTDSLVVAIGYWQWFPIWAEAVEVAAGEGGWRRAPGGASTYYALEAVHNDAASLLVEVAERFGIDGGALASSARLCAELFHEDWIGQQMRAGKINSNHPGRYDTWPDILGSARRLLTADEQRIVSAGEEAMARLCAKADIDAEEPNALVEASATPAKRDRLEQIAHAMMLVRDHPDWSDARIAREVGVNPSTLCKPTWRGYQAAADIARSGNVLRPGFVQLRDDGGADVDGYSVD